MGPPDVARFLFPKVPVLLTSGELDDGWWKLLHWSTPKSWVVVRKWHDALSVAFHLLRFLAKSCKIWGNLLLGILEKFHTHTCTKKAVGNAPLFTGGESFWEPEAKVGFQPSLNSSYKTYWIKVAPFPKGLCGASERIQGRCFVIFTKQNRESRRQLTPWAPWIVRAKVSPFQT